MPRFAITASSRFILLQAIQIVLFCGLFDPLFLLALPSINLISLVNFAYFDSLLAVGLFLRNSLQLGQQQLFI